MPASITFSEKVKKEITSLKFKKCCIKSLLSSFIVNNMAIILNSEGVSWQLRTQFRFIVSFVSQNICNLYNVKKQLSYTEIQKMNNHRVYMLSLTGDLDKIENDLKIHGNYNSIIKNECCKRAYVAGAFMSGGSINSLDKKGYHLEIRSYHIEYLRNLQKILEEFKIPVVLFKRTKEYILYIKKSDHISDFLKLICTFDCFSEFEDLRIQRDFNIQVVRLNNLDLSNMKKTINAGSKQVKQIIEIMNTPEFLKQPLKFKQFCDIRIKKQAVSLSEIAIIMKQKFNVSITRTGLNHYVRKINSLAKNIK